MINLHIIGVQKAGTTALAHFLHQHPEIYMVDGKEAHVFDHPLFLKSPNKMHFAKTKYKKLLSQYNNQTYCCDATPITLFNIDFLTHCFAFNPKAKFIVLLRDPIERAVSHYQMSKRRQQEPSNMLMAFLKERSRLTKAKNNWQLNSPLRTQSYLHRGLYSQQLKALYEVVPAKQVLVLTNQNLREQHGTTLSNVFSFLGISECKIAAEAIFESNKQKNVLTHHLALAYARLFYLYLGENNEKWQNIIREARE